MEFTTADLCDAFPGLVQVAQPLFREYGGVEKFAGPIETLRVHEDNTLVRETLETPGRGRVLVVDGGGSLRCALVGGRLAGLAQSNGWSGVIVNGCVRDSVEIRQLRVGIRALNAVPMRGGKNGAGERGGTLSFAGVTFAPGRFIYADTDGVLVAERDLLG
ncbi:MAG TPA: ribonuclease E activity regulator RraA [Gemmatimonadales bacterium]|nr:ribonuclease E activity regulator RraA [Gemmatimonadales bacterium]